MRPIDTVLEELSHVVRIDRKAELFRDADLGFVLSRARVQEIKRIAERMLALYSDDDIETINRYFMKMMYPTLYAQKYGGEPKNEA